jgi:hypothetical protein
LPFIENEVEKITHKITKTHGNNKPSISIMSQTSREKFITINDKYSQLTDKHYIAELQNNQGVRSYKRNNQRIYIF